MLSVITLQNDSPKRDADIAAHRLRILILQVRDPQADSDCPLNFGLTSRAASSASDSDALFEQSDPPCQKWAA